MSGDIDVQDHNLHRNLLANIPDNLKEFLPEDDGLSYEEVILQQASVYLSYQESSRNVVVATDDDLSNDSSSSSENEGESSRHGSVMSQEAMDEAYAQFVQELGEEFDEFFITQFSDSASSTINGEAQASSPDLTQDDIDPDNMQYEELVNLTETVGAENRGLSASDIGRLPTSIYISRMFSKNKKENCVVCQRNFKFGKLLITLPCSHRYHSKCIITWLKVKKNCPICQKDVV